MEKAGKKKNSTTKYLQILIILLSITLILGGSFAWFADNGDSEGVINFSKVELSEETTVGVNGKINNVMPGSPLISSPVSFSMSKDSEDLYVRAKLSFSLPENLRSDAKMLAYVNQIRSATKFNINTKEQNGAVWSEKQGNYFYLLDNENKDNLKRVSDTYTYLLSNEIVFPRDLLQLNDNYQYSKIVNFHIAFEAIQADNISGALVDAIELFNITFPCLPEEEYKEPEVETIDEGLMFDGNVLVGYYGSDPYIEVPSSYSLTGETTTITKTANMIEELEMVLMPFMIAPMFGGAAPYPFTITDGTIAVTINSVEEFEEFTSNELPFEFPCTMSFEIPEAVTGDDYNVTEIGSGAFAYNTIVKSIDLPDEVTTIGEYAFCYTMGLKMLNLPASLANVAESTFAGMISVEVINDSQLTNDMLNTAEILNIVSDESESGIYQNVTGDGTWLMYVSDTHTYLIDSSHGEVVVKTPEIGTVLTNYYDESKTFTLGNYSIYMCTYAKFTSLELADGVVEVLTNGFAGAMNLESLKISSTVTKIEEYAFGGAPFLNSIEVADTNTVFNDGNGSNCVIEIGTNTLVLGCGQTIIPNTVKIIGDDAFEDNKLLEEITIPNGVTTIGFSSFSSCVNLKNIVIPNSVTKIDSYAFRDCQSLASVTFEENSTCASFGWDVFSGCSSLKSLVIPQSVTSISDRVFDYCTSLEMIIVLGTLTQYQTMLDTCTSLKYILCQDSATSALFQNKNTADTNIYVLTASGHESVTFTEEVIDGITIASGNDASGYKWVRCGAEGSYTYYKCIAIA